MVGEMGMGSPIGSSKWIQSRGNPYQEKMQLFPLMFMKEASLGIGMHIGLRSEALLRSSGGGHIR